MLWHLSVLWQYSTVDLGECDILSYMAWSGKSGVRIKKALRIVAYRYTMKTKDI
jgi:hypothetical protein